MDTQVKLANTINAVRAARYLTAQRFDGCGWYVGTHVVVDVPRAGGFYCTCAWSCHGGDGCKHVIATVNAKAAEISRTAVYYLSHEAAVRQKQMMRQVASGLWVVMRRRPNA